MILRFHSNTVLTACLVVLVFGCGDNGNPPSISPCGSSGSGETFFKSASSGLTTSLSFSHRSSDSQLGMPPLSGTFFFPSKNDGVNFFTPFGSLTKHFFLGTANAQTANVTVLGTLRYEDRVYDMNGFTGARDPLPIRFARVEAIRESDGSLLASGASDGAGDYSLSFSLEGSERFVIRVYSATDTSSSVLLEVRNNIKEKSLYALVSNAYDAASVRASVDLLATVNGQTGGIFNILDVLTDGTALISSQGGTPPLLTVYWESGSAAGTCYNSSLDAIFLLGDEADGNGDTDEYDDDIILHEYGHFLARHFSRDDSPGGSHTISDPTQDTRLSWSEGWAHFLSSAIRRNSSQVDTFGGDPPENDSTVFDIEMPSFFGPDQGIFSSNELAVATVLWDIFDDPSDVNTTGSNPAETFDSLALEFSPVWDVFLNALPNTSPVTLGTFWEGWFARGYNARVQMEQIFSNRQIQFFADSFEPDSSPDAGRKITVPEQHTLYDPSLSDFGQDVDVFAFDAVGGQTYTITTSALSDGGDTFLELLDTNGTTVLLSNDNSDGVQYTFQCGLNCPSNDDTTLSSRVQFSPLGNGTFFIRVTRSPSAPASAGRFGAYEVSVTSN